MYNGSNFSFFIIQVLEIEHSHPMRTKTLTQPLNYTCFCNFPQSSSLIQQDSFDKQEIDNCLKNNGTLTGPGCHEYVPDVFLFSILLFIATYTISITLKEFKFSLFFPSKVRQFISDFSVVIAIFLMTVLDYYVGINTPKLLVPSNFKVCIFLA